MATLRAGELRQRRTAAGANPTFCFWPVADLPSAAGRGPLVTQSSRQLMARFLDANWLTVGDALAIPIWAEASCLMNGRMSNKNDSTDTYQNNGKEDDADVTARELPPEPSHRSFPGKLPFSQMASPR